MRKSVLISVPNNNPEHVVYLPTIWATLKTFAEESPIVRSHFEWLDPIIMKGRPDRLLAPFGARRIDVLGLSCYSWNTRTNMQLAAEVRRRNPDCVIVAGGPDLDYQDLDFFTAFPFIDALVRRDGEIPFRAILEQAAGGQIIWTSVPGLVLPPSREGPSTGIPRVVSEVQLPQNLGRSPWLANAERMEALMARLRQENPRRAIGIPWEIDRGCPFGCTFCDWGSNTRSKVRPVDFDRVSAEAEWIARNRIHVVFLTAANFGFFERDEAILDVIIAAKEDFGFPRVFIWNNAKNQVERVARMNSRAFHAGLVDFHILSVQSLDDEVLSAMNRGKIDKRRLIEVAKLARAENIPCVAQLIFGAPNDSRAKFLGSLTGLMELDIHDEFVAYPFEMLPNAPAADADYMNSWQIRTITRRGSVNRRSTVEESADFSTIIVGTKSYDTDEFVDMYVDGRFVIGLHNSGLTQFISRYLRRSASISYEEFYNWLLKDFFADARTVWGEIYAHCHAHIDHFVSHAGAEDVETMSVSELPDLGYQLSVEEYVLYRIMKDIEQFYRDLGHALSARFGPDPLLSSLLSFQRALMIDPSYDTRAGRRVRLDRDWPAYFHDSDHHASRPTPGEFELTITRTHSGSHLQYPLEWPARQKAVAPVPVAWIQNVIGKHYQRVARAYFHGVTAVPSTGAGATARHVMVERVVS
jgi:putative methyltransferase